MENHDLEQTTETQPNPAQNIRLRDVMKQLGTQEEKEEAKQQPTTDDPSRNISLRDVMNQLQTDEEKETRASEQFRRQKLKSMLRNKIKYKHDQRTGFKGLKSGGQPDIENIEAMFQNNPYMIKQMASDPKFRQAMSDPEQKKKYMQQINSIMKERPDIVDSIASKMPSDDE